MIIATCHLFEVSRFNKLAFDFLSLTRALQNQIQEHDSLPGVNVFTHMAKVAIQHKKAFTSNDIREILSTYGEWMQSNGKSFYMNFE